MTYTCISRTRSMATLLATIVAALVVMTTTSRVEATALTYNVAAHEKACFYAWANEPKKKLAFYFAVSREVILFSRSFFMKDIIAGYRWISVFDPIGTGR